MRRLASSSWAGASRTTRRFPDCTPDTVNGFLHEAYTASGANYSGKVTVSALWARKAGRILNNESSEIIHMLNSEFNAFTGETTDLLSAGAARRDRRYQRAGLPDRQQRGCRCGFAKSQAAYEEVYDGLFATLDDLDAGLSQRRYLLGSRLTEADWRLYPTLVRFDVAYFSIFKRNKKRIAESPGLSNCMRELYSVPGIAAITKPRYYVINYYSILKLNPTGPIPKETPVDLGEPHDRARIAA
jgi:glutathionyl-hydroquinone reductase